jgi:hypothetical protein
VRHFGQAFDPAHAAFMKQVTQSPLHPPLQVMPAWVNCCWQRGVLGG